MVRTTGITPASLTRSNARYALRPSTLPPLIRGKPSTSFAPCETSWASSRVTYIRRLTKSSGIDCTSGLEFAGFLLDAHNEP